jgi:hypothetical protein
MCSCLQESGVINCCKIAITLTEKVCTAKLYGEVFPHHQLYSGVGADIVMESITPIDPLFSGLLDE